VARPFRGRRSWFLLLGLATALSLAGPFAAGAEEVTRTAYREVAEPICKENTEANERILDGVRGDVREGKLGTASTKLAKAGRALKLALNELRGLPQPAPDRVRLTKWFGYVGQEVEYFQLASRQLKNGDKRAASQTVVRLTGTAGRANAQVVPFGFVYCRLQPSRFT
jgi:hypothetical protein